MGLCYLCCSRFKEEEDGLRELSLSPWLRGSSNSHCLILDWQYYRLGWNTEPAVSDMRITPYATSFLLYVLVEPHYQLVEAVMHPSWAIEILAPNSFFLELPSHKFDPPLCSYTMRLCIEGCLSAVLHVLANYPPLEGLGCQIALIVYRLPDTY